MGYFIITSYGRTANFWLASLLNLHDHIFCAYGPDREPSKLPGSATSRENNIKHHGDGDLFARMAVDDYFDLLEGLGDYQIYGSIHAFTLAQALAGTKRDYRLANLIRHPVKRIESFRHWWKWEIGFNPVARGNYRAKFTAAEADAQALVSHFGIDFEVDDNWLFFNAVMNMAWDAADLDLDMRHARMEDMTADMDYLGGLLGHLLGGEADLDWESMGRGKSDKMNQGAAAQLGPEEIYQSWEEWRRIFFQLAIDNFALRERYEKAGYVIPPPD